MAIVYAYEPEYRTAGWFDDASRTAPQWFDRDLVEDPPKNLAVTASPFVDDDDVFFADSHDPHITVIVFPAFFDDEDLLFQPMSIRALVAPDSYLKNEVSRIR